MIPKNKTVFAILLFDLCFVVLPFFDQLNIVTSLWVTSHLQNTGPLFSQVGWPGGPFFLLVWVPSYYVYIGSGFNLYLSVLCFKLILFFFFLLMGYVVFRIGKKEFPAHSRALLIGILLNPAIVYVTLIWIQLDIIPASLVLLSYYLLKYTNSPRTGVGLVFSLLPISIAIYFVYYPVILIPSILLFVGRHYRRRVLAWLILLLGILGIGQEEFLRGWNFSFVRNLNGNGLSSSFYHGLQYFFYISLPDYAVLILIMAIGIPLLLKRYQFSFSDSVFVLILVFLYTSASAGFNNYIWLYPWVLISAAERVSNSKLIQNIITLGGPTFVAIFFANLIMGTGYQQGIFYFGYDVFHINYLFLPTAAQFTKFIVGYNSLLLTSTALALVMISKKHVIDKHNGLIINDLGRESSVPSGSFVSFVHHSIWGKKIPRALTSVLIVLLLGSSSLVFNFNGPNQVSTSSVNGAPVAIFYPTFLNSQYAMAVNGKTYHSSSNTISISSASPPIEFSRNLTNQVLRLNLTFSGLNSINRYLSMLNTSVFGVSLATQWTAYLNTPTIIYPQQSTNAKLANNTFNPVLNQNVTVVTYYGNSQNLYTINNSFLNTYYSFAFRMTKPASQETILWYIANANDTRAVDMYIIGTVAYVAFGQTVVEFGYLDSAQSGWSIAYIHPTANGIGVGLNGLYKYINSSSMFADGLFSTGASLIFGFPNNGDQFNYTFYGQTSLIMRTDSIPAVIMKKEVVVTVENVSHSVPFAANSLGVSISDLHRESILSLPTSLYKSNQSLKRISFGKLNQIPYSLNISVNSVYLHTVSNSGYFLIPIFFFALVPYMICGVSVFLIIERSKHHD